MQLKRKDKQLLNRWSGVDYEQIPTYVTSSILSDKQVKDHNEYLGLIKIYHESLKCY